MLPITPSGPTLTAEQVTILDDEFFSARPLAYFWARIANLLRDNDHSPAHLEKLWSTLGISDPPATGYSESDQELQAAVDALSTRHHVAEALMRLIHALVVPTGHGPRSVWATISEGPTSLFALTQAVDLAFAANSNLFATRLFPAGAKVDQNMERAFEVAWEWTLHARQLLTSNELTVNAAHNKVKHGLAVRARDDVRVELIRDVTIGDDGTVPLSAFQDGNSVPLFDRPMITYLARPFAKPRQGLELTSLRLDVPTVLAEAWMMSVVHAAVFSVAARSHFAAGDSRIPPYPTLPLGPTPKSLLGEAPLGFRGVVTWPADDETPKRRSGVFLPGAFIPMDIDFENVRSATVVDSAPVDEPRSAIGDQP